MTAFWGLLLSIGLDGAAGYVTWHDVSLFGLSLALVAAVVAARLPVESPQVSREVQHRLAAPLMAFLGLLTASVLVAVDKGIAVRYVMNYAAGALFAFLVALLAAGRPRISAIFAVLFALTIGGAVLGILQVLVSSKFLIARFALPSLDMWVTEYARLPRGFGFGAINMNFGKDMFVGWLPALALLLGLGVKRHSWVLGATIGFGIIGLMLSATRSSWAGALAGALYIVLALRPLPGAGRRIRVLAVILLPAIVVGALAFSRVTPWKVEFVRPESDNLRVALTLAGVHLFESFPWLGVGIGNFRLHYPAYIPEDLDLTVIDPRANLPAHNVFLEILTGAGWMALAVYLLILAHAVGLLFRLHASRTGDLWTRTVAAGLLGTLVAYLIDSTFHNYGFDNRLWLLVGLAYALASSASPSRPAYRHAART